MPNIDVETEHLAEADRHIAIARNSIAAVEGLASEVVQSEDAKARLDTLRQTLAAFEDHRAVILRTIEDLREGSLPDRTA
jgi:hypothetical protein